MSVGRIVAVIAAIGLISLLVPVVAPAATTSTIVALSLALIAVADTSMLVIRHFPLLSSSVPTSNSEAFEKKCTTQLD